VRASVQFLADLIGDYLESYLLAARQVPLIPPEGQDKKEFLKRALENGRVDFLAGELVTSEALSRTNLENALAWLIDQQHLAEENRQLKPGPNPVDALITEIRSYLPPVR